MVVKIFDTNDEAVLNSAHSEVGILKKLVNNPNTVKFIDFFEHRDSREAYLVMESAGETSLEDFI